MIQRHRWWPIVLALCAAAAALTVAGSAASATGTSTVPRAGTGTPQTGDFTPSSADATQDEVAGGGESEEGPDPYEGTISLSSGAGGGVGGHGQRGGHKRGPARGDR